MPRNELLPGSIAQRHDDYDLDDSSEPTTPLNRPVPEDAMRRHPQRIHGKPLSRFDTISSLGDTDSQESQESRQAPRRRIPSGSDDLAKLPRLSPSDLPGHSEMKTPRHNRLISIAKDTPLAWRKTPNQRALHPNKAEYVHLRSADEGMGVIIGPMPVEEFLDEFLPAVDERGMPDPTGAFDAVPTDASREKDIYPVLISAINDNNRCPGLIFVDTSVTSKQRQRGIWKPDISVHNEGDVPLLKKVASKKYPGVVYTCANLGLAESFWEVKPEGYDSFCDDHGDRKHFFDWENYGKDSDIGKQKKKAFGQSVSYAGEACARQHRVSYTSVFIIGTKARFFRWDRAGTIVTRAFDYRQNPKPLCQYLWRFGHADMVERGFDSTVTVASPEETLLFESAVAEEVAFQKGYGPEDKEKVTEALEKHFQANKVTKITVCEGPESMAGEYLVSVPVRSPVSTAGRSARCFWSTKLTRTEEGDIEGEAGFLKDVWRIGLSALTPEGTILNEIAGKVPNIPAVDYSGDCMDKAIYDDSEDDIGEPVIGTSGGVQTTKTQDFIDRAWVSKSCRVLPKQKHDDLHRRVVQHVHYRMSLKTVGYPLSDFTDARELFFALLDVLDAIIVAYEKCQRLHRDVSLDNIILCRTESGKRRKGVLIDWEFSVLVNNEGKARDYYRSGTWAFMSTFVLLRLPDFCHLIQDDLESLFYISVYCCVRWLPHNEVDDLGKWMHEFFDEVSMRKNVPIGGFHKTVYKNSSELFSQEFDFTNDHINAWFKKAYNDLSTYAKANQKEGTRWTSKKIKGHLRDLCRNICSFDQEGLERVEHSVEDQIPDVPDQAIAWATHISTSNFRSGSRVSEVPHPEPAHGNKRSRSTYEESPVEPETQNKRSRVSTQEIGDDRIPSTDVSDIDSDGDAEAQEEYNKVLYPSEYFNELVGQGWRNALDEDLSHLPPLPDDDSLDDEDDGQLVSYSCS